MYVNKKRKILIILDSLNWSESELDDPNNQHVRKYFFIQKFTKIPQKYIDINHPL